MNDKLQQLYDAWAALKNEKGTKASRKKAALNIIILQAEIKANDSTFNVIDLSNTKYSVFLDLPAVPMKPSILKKEEIDRIKEETRHFFAIKQIVEQVAREEFETYNNGASVGQATTAVINALATFS